MLMFMLILMNYIKKCLQMLVTFYYNLVHSLNNEFDIVE